MRRLATELSRRGNRVHVLTDGDTTREHEENGVIIHEMPLRWFPVVERWMPGLGQSWHIAQEVGRLHRRHGFDVVEFPNWEAPGLTASLHKLVPTVTRLHTAYAETMVIDGIEPTVRDDFLLWAERTAVRRSTTVTTHTKAHRRLMAESLGMSAGRIHVIPHGLVIPAEPAPTRGPADRKLEVLYVGRLEHRKGTIDLLRAMPGVLKRVGRVHFTLVGGDRRHAPGNRTFAEYFRQEFPEEVQKAVSFTGELGEPDLTRLYRECDLFVGPSLYESFGLIYIEAMRWGKPVVACRVGGVPEVVKDGHCGLLVSPSCPEELSGALVRMLEDHDLRTRMGRQAFEWTKRNFDVALMAERTESLYRETAERFRRNRER